MPSPLMLLNDWPAVLAAVAPSLLVSAAVAAPFGLLGWILGALLTNRRRHDYPFFELRRRTVLREGSAAYRYSEPLIDELRRLFGPSPRRSKLERALDTMPQGLPWSADEFLAARLIEAGALGLATGVAAAIFNPLLGLAVGVAAAWLYYHLSAAGAIEKSSLRLRMIKRRLPYAIDLIANMMQAGSGFRESLETVVNDNRRHPFGQVFGEVLHEIKFGREREEALKNLDAQLQDSDISELVFAITAGEELGVPLGETLRIQADQLRLKRSQWAEKAAAEAQVKIVFPGFVIMLACLIIVVAPFLLKLLAVF